MAWFRRPKRAGAWDLAAVERPWRDAPSIYEHIRGHIVPGERALRPGGEQLPDERETDGLRWVAGGKDGVLGHHGGAAGDSRDRMLHRAIGVVLADASAGKLGKLYTQLLHDDLLEYVDPLLQRIAADSALDMRRLEVLALWLAKCAPDRAPVKLAISILGLIPGSDHSDLLLTLGRHEEFTLYAAVALANSAGQGAERKLFELARHVDGWGRIEVVGRLASTRDPEIKAWMLREGFRNEIMDEYLAYTCASAGGLRRELEQERVDPALLRGAGEIICALIAGGPAEDMDDYADGAIVVERYLHHIDAGTTDLRHLITADCIQHFLDAEDADWGTRESQGWTAARQAALRERLVAVKALPHWRAAVQAGLAETDPLSFRRACQAAEALGIDPWDQQFARLEAGDGDWYCVMQTDDPARIDRVVELAERTLPLDSIATGPAEEMGLGREWIDHSHLDFVLQDLRRFPGKGWSLIRVGLRSPVVRNRNMALFALSPWGREQWPAEAEAALRAARSDEPDDQLRTAIDTLLAGKQLADPFMDADDPEEGSDPATPD